MSRTSTKDFRTLPIGRLGLIPVTGCEEFGKEVDQWLVRWRTERSHSELDSFAFEGYQRNSFLIKADTPRFGSGEGKATIHTSIRGDDLYILVDVCNYSITYKIGPYVNQMSPDDHFQNLKRVIGAVGGKARRINVIMPYLYEGRQDTRSGRESLDCANALTELMDMGVDNIITFDAHEPRVQNATPLHGFETIQTSYQFIKALLNKVEHQKIDNEHFMIVSPDEGGMNRAVYLANVLGVNMGMFYKRLDYTRNIDGQHPVAAYEFLGQKLCGQDIILVDDMISSGRTALNIASLLKKRGAGKIFICATFGHFTAGFEEIDKAWEQGVFDRILTTNLIYQKPELLEKPYYINVDMSKYIALIIDTLNHDQSVSHLLNPVDRITSCVSRYKEKNKEA